MYFTSGAAQYIQYAIESTIFITPFDEGLSTAEIYEVLSRFNFQKGEIKDAMDQMWKIQHITVNWGEDKYKLKNDYIYYSMIWDRFRPDPIPEILKQKLFLYLIDDIKKHGSHNYSQNIEILINNLQESHSFERTQILSFLRSLQLSKWIQISEDNKTIHQVRKDSLENGLQTCQRMDKRNGSEKFHLIFPVVKEVISRRASMLPISSDPYQGFYEQLKLLNAEKYKLWWAQITAEISQLDDKRNPTARLILSAAVCEGILAFIIEFSKDKEFAMTKFVRIEDPKSWKLSEMIRATSSGNGPFMKEDLKRKLESINENRKRIHPAAYLPSGAIVPDLKPEQSQEAFETSKALARAAIDWIAGVSLRS